MPHGNPEPLGLACASGPPGSCGHSVYVPEHSVIKSTNKTVPFDPICTPWSSIRGKAGDSSGSAAGPGKDGAKDLGCSSAAESWRFTAAGDADLCAYLSL